MNPTKLIKSITTLSAIGCLAAAQAQERPNVIFVLADDLGYGDVSALNPESKIHTPNIDALSRGGITFTDAHATSSLSTPSRYSIMTGRYSWRTELKEGVLFGYSGPIIEEGRQTMGSILSGSGYNTACIGKWHLGWDWALQPGSKNRQEVDFSRPVTNGVTTRGGFDYFYGIAASLDMPPYVYVENEMPTAVPDSISGNRGGLLLFRAGPIAPDCEPAEVLDNLFRRSIDFVTAQKESGKPFFLYLPLTAPHTPVLPSAEYQGRTNIGPYGDFVTMVDGKLGELVAALRANGQWDNTILVFTSDNGCAPAIDISILERQGHYPSYIYRGYKTDIYEGGHRIPLVVTWGDRYNNITDGSLVSLSDFYATFAQMAGHKLGFDEAEDSFSLWNILQRKGGSKRRDLVSLSGNGYFALRTADMKLIFWGGSGGRSYPSTPEEMAPLPEMQLYDMSADETERRNLIDDPAYRKTVEKLTSRMRSCVNDGRSTPGRPQKNDTDNNWKQTKLFENHRAMKQPALAGLTALPLLAASVANGASPRQNVVYIMTDQQTYYAISEISKNLNLDAYADNPYFSTPNLDRLVKNGYSFANCYAAHPVSGPSRFALLTGEAPNAYGMTGNFTPGGENGQRMLSAIDARAMGTLFKNAGYQTYYGGKCHLPWANGNTGKGSIYEPPYRYGFDNYLTDDDRDVLAEKGVEFFATHKSKEPFLLFLSFMNPHDICMTQVLLNDKKLEDFTADEIDMRARKNQIRWREVYKTMDKSLFESTQLAKMPFNMAKTDDFPLNREGGNRGFQMTDFNARLHIWFYYRLIEQVDKEIGMVLDALEKSPYKNNTMIVFTSDHGEMACSHGLTGKNVPYEESQRVPLIFVGKGIPKGVMDKTTPVCNGWDMLPTMLEMAGIERPAEQKGISLYKHMTAGETIGRKYMYYETVNSFGVLDSGRFKYTRFVLKDAVNGTESLFDLEKDPGELFNLIGKKEYAPKLDELRNELAVQMKYFGTSDAKIAKGQ